MLNLHYYDNLSKKPKFEFSYKQILIGIFCFVNLMSYNFHISCVVSAENCVVKSLCREMGKNFICMHLGISRFPAIENCSVQHLFFNCFFVNVDFLNVALSNLSVLSHFLSLFSSLLWPVMC